jgi:hypothetical protein
VTPKVRLLLDSWSTIRGALPSCTPYAFTTSCLEIWVNIIITIIIGTVAETVVVIAVAVVVVVVVVVIVAAPPAAAALN